MYENNKNTKVGFSAATLRFFHRFFSLSKNILSSFFSCDGDWWFLVSVQFNGESCRKQNNNIYTHHFNPGSKGIEICSDPSRTGGSKLINTVNHLWSGTCFVFRGNKSAFSGDKRSSNYQSGLSSFQEQTRPCRKHVLQVLSSSLSHYELFSKQLYLLLKHTYLI